MSEQKIPPVKGMRLAKFGANPKVHAGVQALLKASPYLIGGVALGAGDFDVGAYLLADLFKQSTDDIKVNDIKNALLSANVIKDEAEAKKLMEKMYAFADGAYKYPRAAQIVKELNVKELKSAGKAA